MPYTKADKRKAIEFFMGEPVFQDNAVGQQITYDGLDRYVPGITHPDTGVALTYLPPDSNIRFIDRVIRHNYITMRDMTGYYLRQVERQRRLQPEYIAEQQEFERERAESDRIQRRRLIRAQEQLEQQRQLQLRHIRARAYLRQGEYLSPDYRRLLESQARELDEIKDDGIRDEEKTIEQKDKEYLEYMVECELKTYDVDETEECPICYNHYGEQEDGTFLCKNGSSNSNEKKNCSHYCCVKCIDILKEDNYNNSNGKCPICRESWGVWLEELYLYPSQSCFEPIAV